MPSAIPPCSHLALLGCISQNQEAGVDILHLTKPQALSGFHQSLIDVLFLFQDPIREPLALTCHVSLAPLADAVMSFSLGPQPSQGVPACRALISKHLSVFPMHVC